MAQVPSFYYGEYLQSSTTMPDPYPIYTDHFTTSYSNIGSSNASVSNYSPNNYQQGFMHSTTPIQPHESQSPFSGQYHCHSITPAPPPAPPPPSAVDTQSNMFFRNEAPMNIRSAQQLNPKMSNNFDKRYSSEELDEPLNELPMESLLHITHQEGQLINESEVEDLGNSCSSHMGIPMSQASDPASSFYSSDSRNFFLASDLVEDDSGSCISTSTMYSVNSPPEAVHSTSSLNHNYDHSNHVSTSPNPVPTSVGSPFESPSFTDTANIPSHSYTTHNNNNNNINNNNNNNATSPNPNAYSNPNCNTANNNFFSSSAHIPSTSKTMGDYRQDLQNFDCGEIFNEKFKPNDVNEDLKNGEPHHVKKKTKLIENNTKSKQEHSKRSKKTRTKGISNQKKQQQSSYVADPPGSSSDDSSRIIKDFDQQNGEVTEENMNNIETAMDCPGNDVFIPPAPSVSEPKKSKVIRKRMRCPRGMTLEKKPCDVCGDIAKNMHFGGLVCDSCKAFFRRSVQSGTFEQFKCEKEEDCVITKENRRGCQYCRFIKCEKVGMQLEWVMTESGRMSLLKNRLAKTRQVHEEKLKDKVYGDLPRNLDRDDAIAINNILNTLHDTFGSMPYPKECVGDSIDTLSNIFVFLCKRFGKFFLQITEATSLCREDKTLLLKNGIAMSLYINGAHMYDPEAQCWPAESTHDHLKVPCVTLETLQKLADIPDAFKTIMKFYEKYESDLKDHVTAALMYLIAFFLSEDPNFLSSENIQKIQDDYIGYLKRYLIARDGYQSVTGIFLKLMDGLNYVKDILKFHTMVDIKPTVDHSDLPITSKATITQSMTSLIHQIQESFKGNFPPYASVLHEDEKTTLAIFNTSSSLCSRALSRKMETGPVMQNHPDTIAIFGSTTRTDMLITQPLQNMIEWQKEKDNGSVSLSPPSPTDCTVSGFPRYDKENEGFSEKERYGNNYHASILTSSSNLGKRTLTSCREEEEMNTEVDVDAVCDILKQLSYTDDVKVITILKENIPRELLEKFSRSLSGEEVGQENFF